MWATKRRTPGGLTPFVVSNRRRKMHDLKDARNSMRSVEYSIDMGMDIGVEVEVEFEGDMDEWSEYEGETFEESVTKADENASCCSQLFFLWFNPVLRRGVDHDLDHSDLGELASKDDPVRLRARFYKTWEKMKPNRHGHRRIISLFARIIGRRTILLSFLLALIQATLTTALPFVSKAIIDGFQDADDFNLADTATYLAMFSLFPIVSTLCEAHLNFIGRRASTHLYETFSMAIYDKSLRLSAAARSTNSTGKTVTLMATDASTSLQRVVVLMFPMLIAPIQVAVVCYFLYELIGVSMLTGVGILIFALCSNAVVFVFIGKVLRQVLAVTDERIKLVNEMVSGIRILKAYAWEAPFIEHLTRARNFELKFIRKHAYLFGLGINAFFLQLPLILQVTTLPVYFVLGGEMDPGIVFTALQLFSLLQNVVIAFPNGVNQIVTALVALRRIRDFLELPEIQTDKFDSIDLSDDHIDGHKGPLIVLNECTFSWGMSPRAENENSLSFSISQMRGLSKTGSYNSSAVGLYTADEEAAPVLRDISLQVKKNERVAVFGAVGGGKTSLLISILGDLEKITGEIRVKGSLAYAAQNPWMINASIRENILFGSHYIERRYRRVVLACSLLPDFKRFPAGDETMVGERGTTLSGGQKARICLARAIYADASIVLLDDPLAAVDAHVGTHIMERCIMSNLLRRKAVLVVTNQLSLLERFDRVVVIQDGGIVANGKYSSLVARGFDFQSLQGGDTGEETEDDEDEDFELESDDDVYEHELAPRRSTLFLRGEEYFESKKQVEEAKDELYKKEEKHVGTVKTSVYIYYIAAVGYGLAFLTQFFNVAFLLAPLAAQYILTFWTNEAVCELALANNESLPTDGSCALIYGQDNWLILYLAVFGIGFLTCCIASVLLAEARVVSVKRLHERLVEAVFSAPISFYDTTPVGRVLNRFSKDISTIDTQLSIMLMYTTVVFMRLFTGFVGVILGTRGIFVAVLVPVLWIYFRVYNLARRAAIRLQRLEAISRSPLYSGLSEAVTGLTTVRAFNQTERFIRRNQEALRRNVLPQFYVRNALPSWLMVSLNILGCVVSASVAFIVIGAKELDFLSAGEAGLALTYALNLTQNLFQIAFVLTRLEVLMNSVERVKEYVQDTPREEPKDAEKVHVSNEVVDAKVWPAHGEIVFWRYTTGYREGPDVLKDVSFTVSGGEKIGIIGRTGSGKSTMILALLRVLQPRAGSITIDGVDISTIPLHTLRRALGLIPQDPVCFMGTIQFNLDPFGEVSVTDLWTALEKVQLKDFVEALPGGLEFMVQEAGANLSVGQRQLLSIARALLRNTKVLMLDEATANVDKDTDELLQATIRENFEDRTVLTIAHRLETIMDSTRVLVLDHGVVAEFDSPSNLMKIQGGLFSGLVQASREHKARKTRV